jgi:predicted GIY-YIG superfamily endonuclease
VYWEQYSTRAQAQRRELAIKRMRRSAKLKLITNFKSAI